MRVLRYAFGAYFFLITSLIIAQQKEVNSKTNEFVYKVLELNSPISIDSQWDKPQWKKIEAIEIQNFIKEKPKFWPTTHVKMMYDNKNLYLIFRVQDQYVLSVTTEINGPVWKDSAVEFFFSPDENLPNDFFNLEVNCGGTPLFGYQSSQGQGAKPTKKDAQKIEIEHSLPQVVDSEITEPITWTIEYRIPIEMLKNHSDVTHPRPGVVWGANFYKIAENNSNPHYLTWTDIDHPKPHFHLPQYFGKIEFQ